MVGGETWTPLVHVPDVSNPDATVAALLLSDGRILMAANSDAKSKDSLLLLVSDNQGQTWT